MSPRLEPHPTRDRPRAEALALSAVCYSPKEPRRTQPQRRWVVSTQHLEATTVTSGPAIASRRILQAGRHAWIGRYQRSSRGEGLSHQVGVARSRVSRDDSFRVSDAGRRGYGLQTTSAGEHARSSRRTPAFSTDADSKFRNDESNFTVQLINSPRTPVVVELPLMFTLSVGAY